MSIYKQCDIRGVYGEELTESAAHDIGCAAGTILQGRPVVVGGDVRLSTPALKSALTEGLLSCGGQVTDIGTVTTPAFYYAIRALGAYGGMMVTASHNPAKYNGVKLMFGPMPVTPEDIEHIQAMVAAGDYRKAPGHVQKEDILPRYMESIRAAFGQGGLRLVMDCCDGASSLTAPQTAQALGYRVEKLFCGVDGSFPNRDPNPAVYTNLTALQAAVKASRSDLGVAFDGDGDRVVFVDEQGRVIPSEEILVLLIRSTMKPGESVVYDLKSSGIVAREAQALGGTALMERSGHAFIKRRFLENDSVLAGEISGHFFFRELGYDDGLYAAMKVAAILERSGKRMSQLLASIAPMPITPDMRIPVAYDAQQRILDRMAEAGKKGKVSFLDGVRVELDEGWILVRKSVTEEAVTVRMQAKSMEDMDKLFGFLTAAAPELAEGCGRYIRQMKAQKDEKPQ